MTSVCLSQPFNIIFPSKLDKIIINVEELKQCKAIETIICLPQKWMQEILSRCTLFSCCYMSIPFIVIVTRTLCAHYKIMHWAVFDFYLIKLFVADSNDRQLTEWRGRRINYVCIDSHHLFPRMWTMDLTMHSQGNLSIHLSAEHRGFFFNLWEEMRLHECCWCQF